MGFLSRNPKHLPLPTGPYMPGCADVMLGYTKNGIFMRLFYPTDAKKDTGNYHKWASWVPDDRYIVGLARVLMLFPFLIRLVFWWSGISLMPAIYGEKPKTDKKLKCILISHGLGAYRNFYSNTCCELASRGFLVITMEHRENSPGYTYYYETKEDALKDKRTALDYISIRFGEGHYFSRNTQVHKRAEECSRAIDFLINLNKGEVPHNIMDDVPSNKNNSFKLNMLVGKLDLDTLTMMGHSFGAATALLTLSKRPELKQGIMLDPWMFSIKDEKLDEKVHQPLQFINTQTFHLKSNVKIMDRFLHRENRDICTIKHTTHEHQTDTVILIGSWLNWLMRKLDPKTALEINNAVLFKFLHKCLSFPEDITEFEDVLNKNKNNIEYGLTKPWA